MDRRLVVFAVFMVFVHFGFCGVVDELACAKNVHRECQCDIDPFTGHGKSKPDAKWCSKLQSCVECMAIPRCPIGLKRFRSALLTIIVLTRNDFLCVQNKYHELMKTVQDLGGSEPCRRGDKVIYDQCGRRCFCDRTGKKRNCFRVRKEFTQMKFSERRRYVNAYYKATTDMFYKNDFNKILNSHSEIPSFLLHHTNTIFFPWHRWHLLQLENILQLIDCRVTIPYFQWTAKSDHIWRSSEPTDVWNHGPHGLGGNGVFPSYCVKDGKFRESQWKMPANKGGKCLKRNFNFDYNPYTEKKLHKLMKKTDFRKFEEIVRENMHTAFHDSVRGNMENNVIASFAPEFLLHHSFMDKIWDRWQNKGIQYKYAHYTSINTRMPFADRYPWELLDNYNLPGGVAVVYERFRQQDKKNFAS